MLPGGPVIYYNSEAKTSICQYGVVLQGMVVQECDKAVENSTFARVYKIMEKEESFTTSHQFPIGTPKIPTKSEALTEFITKRSVEMEQDTSTPIFDNFGVDEIEYETTVKSKFPRTKFTEFSHGRRETLTSSYKMTEGTQETSTNSATFGHKNFSSAEKAKKNAEVLDSKQNETESSYPVTAKDSTSIAVYMTTTRSVNGANTLERITQETTAIQKPTFTGVTAADYQTETEKSLRQTLFCSYFVFLFVFVFLLMNLLWNIVNTLNNGAIE